jgi:outer membrane protein assembly factor BamE (lipoprotein component of BamABCDE complex)
MKRFENVVLAAGLLFLPAGCGTADDRVSDALSKVRVGMTPEEVRSALGPPQLLETPEGRGAGEIWTYYFTNSTFELQESETVPPPDRARTADRAAFSVLFDPATRTVVRVARVTP